MDLTSQPSIQAEPLGVGHRVRPCSGLGLVVLCLRVPYVDAYICKRTGLDIHTSVRVCTWLKNLYVQPCWGRWNRIVERTLVCSLYVPYPMYFRMVVYVYICMYTPVCTYIYTHVYM